MDELEDRFNLAQDQYWELINKDFPDFNLAEYTQQKNIEANQCDSSDLNKPKEKAKLHKRVFAAFDLSGDGKLDINDFVQMPGAVAKNTASAAQCIGKSVSNTAASFDASKAASDAKAAAIEIGKNIASTEISEVAETAAKIGKTAVGVQGIQDRSAAKRIQEICSEYYDAAEDITEFKRQELNYAITDFGEYRLRALHQTVGRFLQCLERLKQNNATKEYEIIFGADIDTKTLDKMETPGYGGLGSPSLNSNNRNFWSRCGVGYSSDSNSYRWRLGYRLNRDCNLGAQRRSCQQRNSCLDWRRESCCWRWRDDGWNFHASGCHRWCHCRYDNTSGRHHCIDALWEEAN